MTAFRVALQFLTILPVHLARPASPQTIGRSLLWYPLVGGLIGAGLLALAAAAHPLESGVKAALILTAWVLMTGTLHLDGLADSADAWVGGFGDRARTLAIMKDPACGPAGVTALVLVLLLKFAALQALLAQGRLWPLVLAPLWGRTALVALFATTPYVRPGGLGEALARHLPRRAALGTVLISLSLALPFSQTWPAGLAALGAFFGLRRQMGRRLGGTTGDTAGALVEITETAVLVATTI